MPRTFTEMALERIAHELRAIKHDLNEAMEALLTEDEESDRANG